MKKKIDLVQLKVKSFVTIEGAKKLKGGSIYETRAICPTMISICHYCEPW